MYVLVGPVSTFQPMRFMLVNSEIGPTFINFINGQKIQRKIDLSVLFFCFLVFATFVRLCFYAIAAFIASQSAGAAPLTIAFPSQLPTYSPSSLTMSPRALRP